MLGHCFNLVKYIIYKYTVFLEKKLILEIDANLEKNQSKATDSVDFAFLDSGTGGIPYMLYLKEKCPEVKCVYLGDTINFPYGEKTPEQICACAKKACELLISKFSPKAIVIACNTISVTALGFLRNTFPKTPFVGTVPAIKLASSVSKNRRIGLLATNQSVNNLYTTKLIEDFAPDCYFAKLGEPKLIDFIEKSLFTATQEEIKNAIMPSVNYFKSENVDTVILGCTHFLHLSKEIADCVGKDILVVDSREGVANQALRVFKKHIFSNVEKCENKIDVKDKTFFVTSEKSSKHEYETLSKKLNLPYGGLLSN